MPSNPEVRKVRPPHHYYGSVHVDYSDLYLTCPDMTSKRLWLQIARHEIQREAAEEKTAGLTEGRGAGKPANPIMLLCSVLHFYFRAFK